jgi:gephyrin
LIITSGGTGFGPRDITPEAILPLIFKRAGSLENFLQSEAQKITKMACLSRSLIAVIKNGDIQTMIVCLPGKPKAVKENMSILL